MTIRTTVNALVMCGTLLGSVLVTLHAEAQPSRKNQSPQQKQSQTSASLQTLYKALRSEKYLDARKQAETVLRQGRPAERLAASLAYGRILLALDKKKEATEYLARMRKVNLPQENDQQLLNVYDAWLKAVNGKRDDAVQSLQAVLKRGLGFESTADAAEVLAMLHLNKGDKKQAIASANYGLQIIKFHKIDSPYVAELLRRRLKQANSGTTVEAGEAIALYKKAEELRIAEKFVDAGPIYLGLRKQHPKSLWSHAAGYRIGQCLLGIGNTAEAKSHWSKFLAESPTGPWRGQTYVGLIDIALEYDLDASAATKQITLASSASQGNFDKDAKPSWDAASYAIQLRSGLIAFAEHRHTAAAEAFARAIKATKKPPAGLPSLIAAAEKQRELLPNEVRLGKADVQVDTALVAAVVYNTAGDHSRSFRILKRLSSEKNLLRSAAQRAFATGLQARALHGLGQFLEARPAYQAALSGFRSGSWHDETLYHLAILTEQIAEVDPATLAALGTAKLGLKNPTPRPAPKKTTGSDAQRARVERIMKARNVAPTYWEQLLKRFPESRFAEAAHYHTGVTRFGQGRMPDAVNSLQTLITQYSDSGWLGDAHVLLTDIQLEHLFDLPAAESHLNTATQWLDEKQSKKSPSVSTAGTLANSTDDPLHAQPLKQASYDIYVRAGLVAYLKQNYPQAATLFEKAKPFQPPQNFVVVHGTVPTGIEKLISTAKSGKSLTPPAVLEGDETAKLILMLADVYHNGQQYERSLELCDRVVKGTTLKATKTQKSYAYFKRGRNHYSLETDTASERSENAKQAQSDYLAAQKTAPKADWADNAMFLAANIAWNHGDPKDKRAAAEKAVFLWKQIIQRYPTGDEAERAALHIGVAYHWSQRHREAKRAYESALREFPDSRFNQLIQSQLKELEEELSARSQKQSNTKRKR